MLFIRLSWIVGEAGIGKHFPPLLYNFYVSFMFIKQFVVFTINAECEMKVTAEHLYSCFAS